MHVLYTLHLYTTQYVLHLWHVYFPLYVINLLTPVYEILTCLYISTWLDYLYASCYHSLHLITLVLHLVTPWHHNHIRLINQVNVLLLNNELCLPSRVINELERETPWSSVYYRHMNRLDYVWISSSSNEDIIYWLHSTVDYIDMFAWIYNIIFTT